MNLRSLDPLPLPQNTPEPRQDWRYTGQPSDVAGPVDRTAERLGASLLGCLALVLIVAILYAAL